MYVEVGRRTEALDQRDGAAMAFVGLELGTGQQMAREHALHHMQHRRDQLGLCGQQHAKRDGQGQDPLPHRHVGNDVIHEVRRGLRHAPRAARRAEPATLAAERQQLVVTALGAAQPQESMRQDAALEEVVELVFALRLTLFRYLSLPPVAVKDTSIQNRGQYTIDFIGDKKGIMLLWKENESFEKLNAHHRYVIYRFGQKDKIDLNNSTHIITTLPGQNQQPIQNFTDTFARKGRKYKYVITSLNLYNHESKPLSCFKVMNKRSFWRTYPGEPLN